MNKITQGFTLLETILYVALLLIIMTTVFSSVFVIPYKKSPQENPENINLLFTQYE